MKGNKKLIISVVAVALLVVMLLSGTALAAWPSGAQGDQYTAVNNAMITLAAAEGISPDMFMAIYNAAAANALVAGTYTEEELNASCRVLNGLSPYRSVLVDYDTVYNNLSCSSRLASAGVTRSALPKTGIAAIVLAAMGLTGVGGILIHKKKAVKSA